MDHFSSGTVETIAFVGGATFAGYSLGSSPYSLSTTATAVAGVNTVLAAEPNGSTLTGNSGNDLLFGSVGGDTLSGGTGNDLLLGGTGTHSVNGGAGNDTIVYVAGDGSDTLTGGNDTDTLAIIGTSGTGDNSITLTVAGGVITRLGGGNVTTIENFTLNLFGNGTAGDTLSYANTLAAQSFVVNLATGSATGFTSPIAGVENVTGGAGDNSLTGDGNTNKLIGGAGNDTMVGSGGNDILIGGVGRNP